MLRRITHVTRLLNDGGVLGRFIHSVAKLVEGFCEHDNRPSGSIKCREFLD
jgi:hypothetical protein